MFHLRIILTALRSLRQNFARSILATLGVVIGVGAVIAAVSILEGLEEDILNRFAALGADQVIIFNGSERRSGRAVAINSLTPADAKAILQENRGLIIGTAPQIQDVAQIKYYEKNVPTTVLGTTPDYRTVNDYHPIQGRFLTREDVHAAGMVCVLGYRVAEDLFGALPAVGKPVKIRSKTFIVVGVMEERGTLGLMEVDKQVVIPLTTAMGRMFGKRYVTMIVAQCATAEQLPVCQDAVKRTLRATHRIKAGTNEDFIIFTQERLKKDFGQVAIIFAIVLYSIAGISIVVGAIGIMNIMLVSVTERTREIGVRIAVGARRFDILKQFLTEASIISTFGGALGLVCGWAIANFLAEFTRVLKVHTPPGIIAIALGMAFAVGVLSGLYPAVRAARLDPILSLRFE